MSSIERASQPIVSIERVVGRLKAEYPAERCRAEHRAAGLRAERRRQHVIGDRRRRTAR
jgi:hypothetical protein